MITRRTALCSSAAVGLLATAGVAKAAEPPTLEALTREPVMWGAALSPDGQRFACLREDRSSGKRATYIDIFEASAPQVRSRRVALGDTEVEDLTWANDTRLLVTIYVPRTEKGMVTGSIVPVKSDTSIRRMMAIGADGANPVALFNNQRDIARYNPDLAMMVDLLRDQPDAVLMQAWDPYAGVWALHRVDVNTGAATLQEKGGNNTTGWLTQKGVPAIRWDTNPRGSVVSLFARAPGEKDWKFVRKIVRRRDLDRDDFDVLSATEEAGVFYVASRNDDEELRTLRRFDLRTLTLGEPLLSPARDVEGALVDADGRLQAARYTNDINAYLFADKELAAHFAGLQKFFGPSLNVYFTDYNESFTRFILRATGPSDPGSWFFYDRAARHLEPLGQSRPWIPLDSTAKVEALDVRTRDGTTIRAYLTQPQAAGPRPLVVMPHGGPESRDQIEFDVFAQAFAARGWLVLQPNFRGSGGYGRSFADAGRRRWADRMQEDVEDAIAQVLATGRADPARVAICGASYGGYAALMGAVRRPELYKAAVSIAGVADLPDMLDFEREDGEDSPAYRYWVKTMGDPKADAEILARGSPRRRVAEIGPPVLLIHGASDGIVPVKQSRTMAAALKAAGKRSEYLELKDVGHRGWKPETLRTIVETSGDFIAKAFA